MMHLICPSYFAPISFLSAVQSASLCCVYPNVLYDKKEHCNQCRLLASQGVLVLSVPLLGGRNQKALIKEVQISYQQNWILHHEKSLRSCYNKSPWFAFYIDDIMNILHRQHRYLLDLNMDLLVYVFKCLHLSVELRVVEERSFSRSIISSPPQKKYHQVFEEKTGFQTDLSILDLLFNEGKGAIHYL